VEIINFLSFFKAEISLKEAIGATFFDTEKDYAGPEAKFMNVKFR
jgi:hypothetical protein